MTPSPIRSEKVSWTKSKRCSDVPRTDEDVRVGEAERCFEVCLLHSERTVLQRSIHSLTRLCVGAVLVGLIGCGGKNKADDLWWAERHDKSTTTTENSPTGKRSIPAMSRTVAAKRFRAELAKPAPRRLHLLVFANRLEKAGGKLSAPERTRIRSLIDKTSEETLRAAWLELDRPHVPSRAVALRLALLEQHLGHSAKALGLLEHTSGDPSLAGPIARLKQRIARTQKVNTRVIAVLLPLTGQYKKLGREMRLAAVIAAARSPGTQLQFIDTKGDPTRAVAAVEEAVFVHKAAGILGPVGQRESVAAARRAVSLGIPIGLLAPALNGASARDGVFRLWSSPEWEAREAARLAMSLGYSKLAVLAPRGDVGKAQASAFASAVTAGGRRLVRVGYYNPGSAPIEKDIKLFLNLDPKKNRRLRRHLARRGWKRGWKSFSPRIPFDALYIPDGYKRASLVASYMPFFNVEVRTEDSMNVYHLRKKHGGRFPRVVQLFGSSGWHHGGLIPRGGKAVQGAMVIDLFSGSDTEEYAHEAGAAFAAIFKKRVGRTPGAVAAQTFDAAVLMFKARAQASGSRTGVRRELSRQLRGSRILGACGPAAVGSNGEIRRKAIMLRVDGGDFVPHAH